ncbi:hypothetical protein [Nocardia sp. NPDC056000]|uniref:hypothetical protein n=1 Tax=Nocardia sp. NPDC056000 TaxID=3345674 RepID=UPI0035DB4581
MFSQLKRTLCAGLFVLGATAAFTVSGTITAPALPPGTIELQHEFDIYQRASGTNDSPLGFHVSIDDSATATKFTGLAYTINSSGRVKEGVINGRTITFRIEWIRDSKVGIYQGTYFDDGYLRGNTSQEESNRSAEWWSRYANWSVS